MGAAWAGLWGRRAGPVPASGPGCSCGARGPSRARNLHKLGQGSARTPPGPGNVLGTARGGLQRLRGGRVLEGAQGFRQIEGLDHTETFSAVCRIVTVRSLIALATHFDWSMLHFDVAVPASTEN